MKTFIAFLFTAVAAFAGNILQYDPASATVPNRVVAYLRSEDTGKWGGVPNVLVNPVLPEGVPVNECKVAGGVVVALTAQEKTDIAAAEAAVRQAAILAAAKNRFDDQFVDGRLLRAIVSVMVDQINTLRTQPTTVFSAATEAQVRTAIRNKLDAQ